MTDDPIPLDEARHRAGRDHPPTSSAVTAVETAEEPLEDAIKRLAILSLLEYERVRKAEATGGAWKPLGRSRA